jgi:hypothetical protein
VCSYAGGAGAPILDRAGFAQHRLAPPRGGVPAFEQAAEGYKMFGKKDDACRKIVLRP